LKKQGIEEVTMDEEKIDLDEFKRIQERLEEQARSEPHN